MVAATASRNPDFVKFWAGETVSLFGYQVTVLALPLTAVLILDVGPAELGLLRFLEFLPFLLLALPFGVWADRQRRRPLMVTANLVRAVLIGTVPVLAAMDALHLNLLYVIAFTVGGSAVLFDVCWQAFVPTLVSRDRLLDANSKVAMSASAAEAAGPGVAGLLVQAFTAPLTLSINAASYAVSVASLLLIRTREAAPAPRQGQRPKLLSDVAEGLRLVLRNPILRAIAAGGALYNIMYMATQTVFVLYAIRELGFGPGLLGAVLSAGAVGGLLGAALAPALVRRARYGTLLVSASLTSALPALAIPAATGSLGQVALVFIVVLITVQAGVGVSNVLTVSLRQAVTPNRLLGRVNAAMRMIMYGGGSFGALAGGYLGQIIGLRASLWVAGAGTIVAVLPLLLSPIPSLRTVPDPVDPAEASQPA